MIIAIAVCTTKQLMQFIPTMTPELLADEDIASKLANYTLDNLSKRCDKDEQFTNAMVTAVDPADQPFAQSVRDWIYRHLGAEPSVVSPLEVVSE